MTLPALLLLVRALFGITPSDEVAQAIVDTSGPSCARLASVVTVCYKESNLLTNPTATIMCGATRLWAPSEPGDRRRIDRRPEAQAQEVARVFGDTRNPAILARRFANWRCGGNAPRCVATTGALYAAQLLPIWTQVYTRCRRTP